MCGGSTGYYHRVHERQMRQLKVCGGVSIEYV